MDHDVSEITDTFVKTNGKTTDRTDFKADTTENSEIIDKDVAETTEKTTEKTTLKSRIGESTTEKLPKKLTQTEEKIIRAMLDNPNITQSELAKRIGLSVDGIRYAIKNLKAKEILSREGSRRHGIWRIHLK